MELQNTNAEEAFSFEPLRTSTSIRLVRRCGLDAGGLINISLETVDLLSPRKQSPYFPPNPTGRNRPWFHCLSYTWGNPHAYGNGFEEDFRKQAEDHDPAKVFEIRCNGKILKIGKNLHDYFQQCPTDWTREISNRPNHETGRIRLHNAAASGDSSLTHLLLGQGSDPNATDHEGQTPLHLAASNGQLEAAKILCKAGARIDISDDAGRTPIQLAESSNDEDIVGFLKRAELEDEVETLCSDVPPFPNICSDDYVWIDAICIDQSNLAERTAQVRIMDMIYSLADYVLVWLGEEDRYIETALRTVSKLVHVSSKFVDSKLIPYRVYPPEDYERFSVPYISHNEWKALAALWLRQWFRRIWVVQESVFARAIVMYCGTKKVSWQELGIVAEVIRQREVDAGHKASTIYVPLKEIASSIEDNFWNMAMMREMSRQLRREPSGESSGAEWFRLYRLIYQFFPFRATDPRDKIYALLAISHLHPSLKDTIDPDYSIPVEHCFASLTKFLMQEMNGLNILSWVQDRSMRVTEGLPSWVPDFSLSGTCPFLNREWSALGVLHGLEASYDLKHSWNELLVRGIEIDVVVEAAAPRFEKGKTLSKLDLDESWYSLIGEMQQNKRYEEMGQSPVEVLWRTLCADMQNPTNSGLPREFGSMFKELICAMICTEPEISFRKAEADRERAIQLAGLLQSTLLVQEEVALGDDSTEQSRGPDEKMMATIRHEMSRGQRSIQSAHFDSVRHVLPLLENLRRKYDGDSNSIPTAGEIEEYFQRGTEPLRYPNGRVYMPHFSQPYIVAHFAAYAARRLFKTKSGYLGLGPGSLQVGDIVCLIPGLRTPVLLRPQNDSSNWTETFRDILTISHAAINAKRPRQAQYIGEAYVHGIMFGEAASQHKQGDLVEFLLT
ncbi:hypothetical protein BX600DRAFT_544374 [Xylariales sp. PMI_506]|nr:hypothetical protein BX600DRAFT_544374 [Xylariales sp. PMI_506]